MKFYLLKAADREEGPYQETEIAQMFRMDALIETRAASRRAAAIGEPLTTICRY
jgi:hypothetical protein